MGDGGPWAPASHQQPLPVGQLLSVTYAAKVVGSASTQDPGFLTGLPHHARSVAVLKYSQVVTLTDSFLKRGVIEIKASIIFVWTIWSSKF